jgi:hypothetical protein
MVEIKNTRTKIKNTKNQKLETINKTAVRRSCLYRSATPGRRNQKRKAEIKKNTNHNQELQSQKRKKTESQTANEAPYSAPACVVPRRRAIEIKNTKTTRQTTKSKTRKSKIKNYKVKNYQIENAKTKIKNTKDQNQGLQSQKHKEQNHKLQTRPLYGVPRRSAKPKWSERSEKPRVSTVYPPQLNCVLAAHA